MMSGKGKPQGYTIVETMIFLAVTSLILISALTLVNGAQRKNEFIQAINDVDRQINDVINDVANGHYVNPGNLECNASTSPVTVTIAGTKEQGQNEDCIMLGRVIHFNRGDNQYRVFTVAGARQFNNSGVWSVVGSMEQAKPALVDLPGTVEVKTFKNGLNPFGLRVPGSIDTSAIGFFSTLGTKSSSNPTILESSSLQLDIATFQGTNIYDPTNKTVPALQAEIADNTVTGFTKEFDGDTGGTGDHRNPRSGVELCFNDYSASNRMAVIKIGGEGRTASTEIIYRSGACPL